MADDYPKQVNCPGCGQSIANGSIYCPHCCGEAGRYAALLRGALFGGAIGLLVGAVIAALWSYYLGPERATLGRAFAVLVACATTGLMWGMIRRRGH